MQRASHPRLFFVCMVIVLLFSIVIPPAAIKAASLPVDTFELLDWLNQINAPSTGRLNPRDPASLATLNPNAQRGTAFSHQQQSTLALRQVGLFDRVRDSSATRQANPSALNRFNASIGHNTISQRLDRSYDVPLPAEGLVAQSVYLPLVLYSNTNPVTMLLTSDTATELLAHDGTVRLVIAKGTVTQPTLISLKRIAPPASHQAKLSQPSIDRSFSLSATALDGSMVTTFNQPITVQVSYPEAIPSEQYLSISQRSTTGTWQTLKTSHDLRANIATTTLNQTGTYALTPPPSDNIWQVGHIVWLCKGAPLFSGPGEDYTIHTIVPNDFWEVLIIGGPFTPDGTQWWHIDRNGANDPSGGQGWTRYVPSKGCDVPPGYEDDGFGILPYSPKLRKMFRLLGTNPYGVRIGGDPVNTANGNFIYQKTDIHIPGVAGLDFDLTRVFNSLDPREGVFGHGVSSVLDTSARLANDGSVDIRKPDGSGVYFTKSGDSYTPGFKDTTDRLEQRGDMLVLTTPDQLEYHFPMLAPPTAVLTETGGFVYVTKIKNRNDATIQFTRDQSQHISQIIDSGGRPYAVTYDGDYIATITDPIGRQYSYTYADGDLLTVSNQTGGVISYTYADHRIISITDPESMTYLKNTYDGDGKLTDQIGSTGATASFTYTDNQTIFKDYEGNITTDTYNDDDQLIATTNALNQTTKYEYDPVTWRVRVTTDRRDGQWITEFDQAGNLIKTVDPLGHTVTYTYNATNDLTSVTDSGGLDGASRTTTYDHDSRGNLIAVHFPDNTKVTMTYDSKGQLITSTDARANTSTNEYDAQGNTIRQTDPLSGITQFAFDGVGRVTTITDAKGHQTQISYDANDNVTKIIDPRGHPTTMNYDRNDNLIELVDRTGGVWHYGYDSDLNLISQTDPLQHTITHTYDTLNHRTSTKDARGNTTQFRYDAIYRLVEIEDALHGITKREYDPNDNLIKETDALDFDTTYEYDAANRLVTITDALDGETTYTYDSVNRQISMKNPRGALTQFRYDLQDRVIERIDALGGRWRSSYDPNGNMLTFTDPLNHTIHNTYDANNRLTDTKDAGEHTTHYEYDAVGNIVRMVNPRGYVTTYDYDENDRLITITDALNGVTRMVYDAEERLIATTDANGNTTQFAYDLDGSMIQLTEAGGQISRYSYDENHNLIQFTNAKGNSWQYTYDELNRRTSERDPLNHRTTYRYDAVGQMVTKIDANGVRTRYDFDALRRLVSVVQNEHVMQPADYQTNVKTKYVRDAVGNIITVIRPNGTKIQAEYDLLDRKVRETDQLGQPWVYRYDAASNVIERIDAKNQHTRYVYDADNLLILIDYASTTQHDIQFGYDPQHNQTTMTDGLGLTTNVYDALDRLTSSTNHLGQNVQSAYDPVGNRIALTYPDGRTVHYSYDPTNFVTQIVDPDGWTFDVSRDPTHNVVHVQNPNDTTVDYTIDAAERLTNVVNLTGANPHEVISSFAYTLDPVGNKVQSSQEYRWRKPTAITETYQYDPLYRLIRSEDSDGHFTDYAYDVNSNRIRMTTNDDPTLWRKIDTATTTYSYNDADELITSVREVLPRGNVDRTAQTSQMLRSYVHEVEAQRNKHIDQPTADNLLSQATALITALDGSPAPQEDTVAQALADLHSATATASDNSGIVNSLQVKLDHAENANAKTGGDFFATLYSYDKNGNRVQVDTPNLDTGNERDWTRRSFEYDIENRLVHAQDFHSPNGTNWLPADETFLIYDGYGRLFRRQHDQHISGGGDQHWIDYVYDGLDPIVEYRDPSPQYTNYYRGLGHILSQHDYKSQTSPVGTLTYYHYDGLDSVSALTKHQGQSVHNYRYHDFGIILDINGHAADASNFTDPHNHYGYTGHEWDEYLELHHTYAREYDPFTSTWLQRDPYRGQISDPMTLHRYGYVGNNPLTYADPLGYFGISEVWGYVKDFGSWLISSIVDVGTTTIDAYKSLQERYKEVSEDTSPPQPAPGFEYADHQDMIYKRYPLMNRAPTQQEIDAISKCLESTTIDSLKSGTLDPSVEDCLNVIPVLRDTTILGDHENNPRYEK